MAVITIRKVHLLILEAHQRIDLVLCAAAPGTMVLGTLARPFASGVRQEAATTVLGFGLWPQSSDTLPLVMGYRYKCILHRRCGQRRQRDRGEGVGKWRSEEMGRAW